MPRIHVCPLSQVDAMLAASGARSVVSLLALHHRVPRFATIAPERQLHLALSDIVAETPDHILPDAGHIDALLAFLRRWDREAPLLIHCYAGVSRSTAAAFIALCLLDPGRTEADWAQALRCASPTATPNPRLVALADAALGRSGRMIAAIAAIGRGVDCYEGVSFGLDIPSPRQSRRRELRNRERKVTMVNADTPKIDLAAVPFEAAMKELEDIVTRLEKGNVTLEESIAIYERGEALRKHCEGLLHQAEMRIEKITLGSDGAPSGLVPLDVE